MLWNVTVRSQTGFRWDQNQIEVEAPSGDDAANVAKSKMRETLPGAGLHIVYGVYPAPKQPEVIEPEVIEAKPRRGRPKKEAVL